MCPTVKPVLGCKKLFRRIRFGSSSRRERGINKYGRLFVAQSILL